MAVVGDGLLKPQDERPEIAQKCAAGLAIVLRQAAVGLDEDVACGGEQLRLGDASLSRELEEVRPPGLRDVVQRHQGPGLSGPPFSLTNRGSVSPRPCTLGPRSRAVDSGRFVWRWMTVRRDALAAGSGAAQPSGLRAAHDRLPRRK